MQKFGGYLYHADTAWVPKFRTFRSEGDPYDFEENFEKKKYFLEMPQKIRKGPP